jgi:hypothetical protein
VKSIVRKKEEKTQLTKHKLQRKDKVLLFVGGGNLEDERR